MAATRLIPLHVNKGKTVAQCLDDRTDYSENAAKTNNGESISSYMCDPKSCDQEFLLAKREYQHRTGRQHKHDVIAYQIRQSFASGEITPEEANKIGYETAIDDYSFEDLYMNIWVNRRKYFKISIPGSYERTVVVDLGNGIGEFDEAGRIKNAEIKFIKLPTDSITFDEIEECVNSEEYVADNTIVITRNNMPTVIIPFLPQKKRGK